MITTTLARPYAKAAFEYALENKSLKKWSTFLQSANCVVEDKRVMPLLHDPRVDRDELANFIITICDSISDQHQRNFLKLLAENQRLILVPAITQLFEQMLREEERKIDVEVISAFPLTEADRKKLEAALEKRFASHVVLNVKVDEKLIGGAVIRAGDKIIDGSVRGKLTRLATELDI